MTDHGARTRAGGNPDAATASHFHLFTYGSLKSTQPQSVPLLQRCRCMGRGEVRGTLFDVGEYPALMLAGDDVVRGEVWRCPWDVLPELDRYEGVGDSLFRRAAVEVDGTVCWVYVAGPRLGPRLLPDTRIESGEWNA